MKLILTALVSSIYCSEVYQNNGKERRLAGGGNYGGFIGLTTYGAGPFFVKGKYENRYDTKSSEDYNRERNKNYDKDSGRVENNEDLEYLGYNGNRGYCIGEYRDGNRYDDSNQENRNYSNYFDEEIRNRCDKIYGYTGPTANDEPDNLIRPCALDDWQCIRKYFAANSDCKPAYGPIPDPLHIDINTVFFTFINVTAALPNLMVRGLSNTRIREFYVNKKSRNLVLTLDVSSINETVPRAYFRYRRTAKESIVLADFATVTFNNVIFTAIIPNVPHLRLDLAEIHADVQDAFAPMYIGPGAASSSDPDVISAFSQLLLMVPVAIREGMFYQAQLFTSIFIQKNICDFGLHIISV